MYTSGRSVKSRVSKANPFTDATKAARKLVTKHLPANARPTINTDRAYATDLTERVRVTITFAEMDRSRTKALADAIEALPRYRSMCWNSCSITYLIDLEG